MQLLTFLPDLIYFNVIFLNKPILLLHSSTFVRSNCSQYGFAPNIRQEANDIQMMLSFVSSGFGITLLPESSSKLTAPGTTFIPLKDPAPEIQMAIAWLYESEPSPLRQSLLDTIQSIGFS